MKQTLVDSKRFKLLLIVIPFVCAASQFCDSKPATDSSCYAFIRQGALILKCSGELTAGADLGIEGFAVSADGNWLALKRDYDRLSTEQGNRNANSSKLISLKNNTIKDLGFYPDVLSSSCGTLLGFRDRTATIDLIAGHSLLKPSYTFFRCSKDANVIAGYVQEQRPNNFAGRNLWTGQQMNRLLSNSNAYLSFDVSPSGNYTGFAAIHGGIVDTVCIVNRGRSPDCVHDLVLSGSSLSVSDSGQVLFEQSTAQECSYQDSFHFALVGKGYPKGSRDACVSLFNWRAGQSAPEMIQDLGRSPQWIQIPSALEEWLRRRLRL